MATVLLVDDETDIRDQAGQLLGRAGHDVKLAATGSAAIEIGTSLRPDVLVADWLLKSDIHGLHVSQVLQAVDPRTETILVSGFMSPELHEEASNLGVFDVLEKPYEPDALVSAVGLAADAKRTDRGVFQVAVADVAEDGTVLYANPEARALFGRTRAGREPRRFADLFRPGSAPRSTEASTWIDVRPEADPQVRWHLHSRPMPDGRWLAVIVPDEMRGALIYHPLVQMLLNQEGPPHLKWPFDGRVLVVDDEELIRRFALAIYDQAGATCHVAADVRSALDVLRRDEGVRVVLLDWGLPGSDVESFARDLQSLSDRLTVIGQSGADRRAEFKALGIPRFIAKPWRIRDVVEILTERIDTCEGCRLRIPLRKALPGERDRSWTCCGCGRAITGLVDTRAEAAHLFNVRPDFPDESGGA